MDEIIIKPKGNILTDEEIKVLAGLMLAAKSDSRKVALDLSEVQTFAGSKIYFLVGRLVHYGKWERRDLNVTASPERLVTFTKAFVFHLEHTGGDDGQETSPA